MDEIVGVLVEQLAKRAREEAARRAQAGGPVARGAPPRPPARAAAAPSAPGIATPRRPVTTSSSPPPPAAAPQAAPRPAAPADVFGTAVTDLGFGDPFGLASGAGVPAAASAQAADAPALLRAFTGGQPLLAAIVLSEALAPPVALRSTPPV